MRHNPPPARRPGPLEAAAAAVDGAMRHVLAAGVEAYRRERMLPRLVRATSDELRDGSVEMRRRLLARLARALAAERRRGRAGHWTYDLNRHIGLTQAFMAEKRSLEAGTGP